MLLDTKQGPAKEIMDMITPQVTEDGTSGGLPLKHAKYYSRLTKALGEGVRGSDGKSDYEKLVVDAKKEGVPLNRAKIWQDPILRGKMETLLSRLEIARERGPEALQDAIRQFSDPVFNDIARSWKNGSIGQVINSAINDGGMEGTLLKPDEMQDAREVEALTQNLGRNLMVQPQEVIDTVRSQPTLKLGSHVRQPVQVIVGSDVKSQGIGAWRDGKHEDHNHYAFESTAHRDQAAAWVKSEYKRRWGNEYLLNRDELEINHHEDRQGSSHHGAQGGHRASDVPRHNFVYGEGEVIGANRVHQLYAEWFKGGN
jgi:hypothetical protein